MRGSIAMCLFYATILRVRIVDIENYVLLYH